MDRKRLYIGIDLGDRSYSVDAVNSMDNSNHPVKLPGQLGNAPILSAVGKQKDGAYVLLRDGEEYDTDEFADILINFKRRPTAMRDGTQEMVNYETGVKEMLRLTLGDEETCKAIRDLAMDCEEIVFCIGYPTNWSKEDVSFFHNVLNHSLVGDARRMRALYGKPVRILEERESTAAFIYARTYREDFGINKNTPVLVLDFGSSTVNVTALTIGERNTSYNSGHNFFGGRMVDCLLADYYISQLSDQERVLISGLDRLNRGVATALILMEACAVKERLSTNTTARFETSILPNRFVRITRETFDKLLEKPLAPIVRRFHLIPEEEATAFGERGWRQILTDYLAEEKRRILNAGIRPELVIAAGGGSLLSDTRKICQSLFEDVVFLDASDATSTISRGLALAAKRADRSGEFNRDVDTFLTNKMPTLVKAEIPALANAVSEGITNYMCDKIIIPQFMNWREGRAGYDTLNDTSRRITETCSTRFTKEIQENPEIQKAIREWSVDKLGTSVAGELSSICSKYNVQGFTMDTLNVMKTPTIAISGKDALAPLSPVIDVVGVVVSVVTAFLAASLSGAALMLVLEIIYLFLPGLAMLIFEIVMIIPGGPVILAGVAGVAVFKLIRSSWDGIKDQMMERLCDANLPVFCRKAVSENRIKGSINSKREEVRDKIKNSISGGRNADDIARQISDSISKQISMKLDEIRYAMEMK